MLVDRSCYSARRAAALVIVTVLASAPGADAAGTAPANALRSLDATIVKQSKALGAGLTRTLGPHVRATRSAHKRGRPCEALRASGRVIAATKGLNGTRADAAAEVGSGARALQLTLVHSLPQGKRCGMARPTARVDRRLTPTRTSLPALGASDKRPLARLVGANAGPVDFVAEELLVQTADAGKLDALLKRLKGTVLRTARVKPGATPVHLVRIDAARGRPAELAANLIKLDPRARGSVRVSSRDGLGLLSAAAAEAARGLKVGLNYVGESQQFLDRVATEAPAGSSPPKIGALPYSPNPFEWRYMNANENQNMAAAEGWRTLEIAKKLSNRVRLAIIDGGFAPSADFSPASVGANGTPNAMSCGANACPWHGTGVASAAGAVADNGFGVAGSAGPIADLTMIQNDGTIFGTIMDITVALATDARIINMSFHFELDMMVSFTLLPLEAATMIAASEGVLVFAAAGNDGTDIDAEDCALACWEEEWFAPCENVGVICVGGLEAGSKWRHANSNYGYEWCGKAPCDVDIFAPYTVYTGPDPDNAGNRTVNGTSYAAPYAAGVAALIWAAKPSLSAAEVRSLLMTWAHGSPDKKVHRYVNAQSSIAHALGGDLAPAIEIDAPAGGAEFGAGPLNPVAFKATVGDIEDATCCAVSWSSDVDGPIGTGLTPSHAFSSPGTRVVTATVTDSTGKSATDTVTISVTNAKPSVTITKPGPGATLYRNASYVFQGKGYDPNEPLLSLPCSTLEWTSTTQVGYLKSNGPSGSGCQTSLKFALAGTYTVKLTGTDSGGASDTATIKVTVVEQPPNSKPAPQIVNQPDGVVLDPTKSYLFSGTANEPDGDLLKSEWTMTWGSQTKVIGTGPVIYWKPGDDVFSGCSPQDVTVTLKVTDKDGTGSDTNSHTVQFGPC